MQKAKQIFIKGLFLTLAFLMVGIGEVEKVNANDGSSIAITSPNGGELWESNSSHLITWTQTNIDKVSLYACYGVYSSTCEIIVSSLETSGSTGSYDWNIPADFSERVDYKISVVAWQTGVGTSSDKSDEVFIIGDSTTSTGSTISTDYDIQLLSQTTDEVWEVGKSYVIQWSNSNPDYIKEMNVSLATVDGTKWFTFNSVDSIKGQTNYSTTVVAPVMDGSDYKIKLRGEKAYDGYLTETVSSDGFINLLSSIPTPSSITVISPNGGEEWTRGRAQDTTWTMTGIEKAKITLLWNEADGSPSSHQIAIIDYSLDIYGNPVVKPADNEYKYDWFVPSDQMLGTNYRVQVSDADKQYVTNSGVDYDISDDYFSIIEKADDPVNKSITVVSPNGGEELKIGEQYLIKWNTTGDINQVTVALNKSGVYIKNLIWNLENNGSVSWTPDLSLKSGNDYKIRITDPDSGIYDESDNYFSIAKSSEFTCLPDNTLLKISNDPKIYVIRDCQRYWIRTAEEFQQGGYRWEDVQESTSDVVNALPEVSVSSLSIQEGALIRTRGDVDIYIVKYIGAKKFKRLILNPSVFNSYRHLKWENVIEVEAETTDSFATSNLVRDTETGEIYRLTANGDAGLRRHFRSINVMQGLGYDLDAVYEINRTDRNSYQQGEDLG